MYESKSKTILPKNRVPKIEDLHAWIIQHPSYQITKPLLRKSPPKLTQRSKDSVRSIPCTKKPKPLLTPMAPKKKLTTKSIPNRNDLIPLGKSTSKTNMNSTTDLRSKVPTTLYDKIILRYMIFQVWLIASSYHPFRFEKSGEPHLTEQEIRKRVFQIEQEMFRFYGKVDNSYKNKFRSLLANINNMNNNVY